MLLAIDTATRVASLALHDGSAILAEATWQLSEPHTVELMPRIVWMLEQAAVRPGDLSALAVAIGPGSFTGLRIGLALAKGLALAHDLPIAGIPTLDALARAQPIHKGPLVGVLQAGRGKLAAMRYRRVRGEWRPQGEVSVTTVDRIGEDWTAPTWLCGELSADERAAIRARLGTNVLLAETADALRRAGYLAELGWRRIRAGQADDLDTLRPMYIPTAGIS
jgi:tRNA threonylcarbamoyladenosine biosynthesis protein TsaB